MINVGIDVSKGKSTVCGMKPDGEILYKPFGILHTKEDLQRLISPLQGSGEEVCVALESTGYYHCPVVAALLEGGMFCGVRDALYWTHTGAAPDCLRWH